MLRLTPQQVDVFNAPLWRMLEQRVIGFIQSRASDLEETDPAFLTTACQQLIPKARGYGFQAENPVARYVYLSLKLGYKASGQDVFQTLGLPPSPVALLQGQQSPGAGAPAAEAGQIIDQSFSPSPLSPVLRCAVDMSSPTQQAVAVAQMPGPDGKPDPCAPARLDLANAQQAVARAEEKAAETRARGLAEIAAADAEFARTGDYAARDKHTASLQQVRMRGDAAQLGIDQALKAERAAQVALAKCQAALPPPQ